MSQKCMCGGRGKGDKGVSAFFLNFFLYPAREITMLCKLMLSEIRFAMSVNANEDFMYFLKV